MPTLTLLTPNGRENWPIDSSQTIEWTSSQVQGNVQIELTRDGGSTWETIVADTANDGAEPWLVTGPVSVECRIRLRHFL